MSRDASSGWKRSDDGFFTRLFASLSARAKNRSEKRVNVKNTQSNRSDLYAAHDGTGAENAFSAPREGNAEAVASDLPKDFSAVSDERGTTRGGRTARRGGRKRETTQKPPRERRDIPAEKVPFSVTDFEVYGLNHARLLSLLSERAHLRRVRSEGRVFSFCAPSREKAKIVAILDTLCYDYKIKSERGIPLCLLGAVRRAGVVCGVIAVTVALAVFPHSVTSVECVGEWNSDVARILSDNGIVEGNVLFSFDGAAVAEQLRALDGVVYASVEKVGTRVCVEVRAEHRSDSFLGVAGASVTATRRAVVTRVVVFSGTAVVDYGDVVSAGDELIGGFVVVGEEKVPSAAAGEVYGTTYTEYSRFFPDTEITAVKGASKTYTRVTFGSGAPKAPEPPFGDYILETTVTRNGLLIGYYVHTFRFTEVTYVERENTRTEEEMKALALSDAVTELPAGTTVLSAETTATRAEGGTLVKVTVAAEQRIDSAL